MALRRQWLIAAALPILAAVTGASRPCQAAPPAFHSFKVTVYIPVQAVERMAHDPAWMRSSWHEISSRLHVDQVFIEDYRSGISADDADIARVKQYFVSQGTAVAGGMAMLGAVRSPQFQTLDYALPGDRALASRMSALLARHFDTFVLDDLYFFNTKSDADIAAKGRQSWAQFRMRTMDEVSRDLILKPAKAANPHVKVIIKFPNFYPFFQEMGFDLKNEPNIFPEIWTGDETRDATTTDQQLRPYESYEIFRYFDNIAPGRNGGGWADPIAMQYLDRYAGQLWDTILAKAPAINLFQYTDLLSIADPRNRDSWERLPTTFDYFYGAPVLRRCPRPARRELSASCGRGRVCPAQSGRRRRLARPTGGACDVSALRLDGRGLPAGDRGNGRYPDRDVSAMAERQNGLPDAGGGDGPQHRFHDRAPPARR
jgi:hypothetical protein